MAAVVLLTLMLKVVVNMILGGATSPRATGLCTRRVSVFAAVFLQLVGVVVTPLIISALIMNVTGVKSTGTLNHVFSGALFLFVYTSLLSVTLNLVAMGFFVPNAKVGFITRKTRAAKIITSRPFALGMFVSRTFPADVISTVTRGRVLRVIIFSVFLNYDLATVNRGNDTVIRTLSSLTRTVLGLANCIVLFTPLAMFTTVSTLVTRQKLTVVIDTKVFVNRFCFAVLLL